MRVTTAHAGAGLGRSWTRAAAAAIVALVASTVSVPSLVEPTHDPSAKLAVAPAVVDPVLLDEVATGSAVAVVRTRPGALDAVAARAERHGIVVVARLDFIDSFVATVDEAAIEILASDQDVLAITADHEATLQGEAAPHGGDDFFEDTVGASPVWAQGHDGSGVGIAVLDSGVADIAPLAGRLGQGVDLTSDDDDVDHVGHGTFLAGLAAGDGTGSDGNHHAGIAPGAHIIPVKVGSDNGVSLIGLLQGLQWVHHHRDSHDIDVVNLSFGTNSAQSFTIDPLNFAVQQLWADGIVVVVAAGNLGDDGPGSITKPGDDPFVITVGASDSLGTVGRADDQVPAFSGQGPTKADGIAKPDLVAPGRSVVGPVAPGSAVDAMTEAHVGPGWVRATGTSFSAAIVSGAVALVLDAHPDWTPDQVKGALQASAAPGPVGDPNIDGHGALDVLAAVAMTSPTPANQGIAFGTGVGTLEDTIGEASVALAAAAASLPATVTILQPFTECFLGVCVTVDIEVEVDAEQAEFFDLARYRDDFDALLWDGTQWYGHRWYDHRWFGHQWYGHQWYGHQWYGHQWYGHQWYGHQWYGHHWYGHHWYGHQWYGHQWYGHQWYANGWA